MSVQIAEDRKDQLPARLLGREDGFTLVEVLVTILLLSVGILGTTKMAIQASSTTADTKAREGATNLAREVVEGIVSLPYGSLDPGTVTEELQAQPGLAPTAGYSGWTVVRRDIPYTLSVTGCSVDDPVDGLGVHDTTFCPGSGSANADETPIDYRRFTVRIGWQRKDGPRSISQTTLVAPRGQSEAPAITSLTSTSGITITDPSLTSLSFNATTSAVPAGVAWSVEGAVRGLATGGGKAWSFAWNIAGLPDGRYDVGATAYNSSGTYGTPASLTITLNRTSPAAPLNFAAGWNRTASRVDTEWLASTELDTVGYRVYRQQVGPTTGAVTPVNCGTVATPVYVTTKTTCTDASPIIPPTSSGIRNIAFRSRSVVTGNAVASLTLPTPAGVKANDVLVATVAIMGRPGVITPPGWTKIRDTVSSAHQQAVFYRVAGSPEPSSHSFGASSGTWRMAAGVSAYTGVDTSAPIDASVHTSDGSGDARSPSVITTSAGDLLVNAVSFASAAAGSTVAPPAGFTERYDVNATNLSHEAADQIQASAGASGTKTSVPSGAHGAWISQLVALRPAGGGNGISVNYWVRAVDRDGLGNFRDGPASNVVDAYEANLPPTPISGVLTCTIDPDGTKTLTWAQPAQPGDPDSDDFIVFDRVYRDGSPYDITGSEAEDSWVDPDPSGTHIYHLRTVDTHLMESTPSGSVTC